MDRRERRAHERDRHGRKRDPGALRARAAGNFIYIGAADLIPEVKAHAEAKANVVHFAAFAAGVALMLAVKLALEP